MNHKNELDVPPSTRTDAHATEVLRVWLIESGQQVILAPSVWEDPAAWGLMLADIARHVANAYHLESGMSKEDALLRVRVGLLAELDGPTDEPTGSIR